MIQMKYAKFHLPRKLSYTTWLDEEARFLHRAMAFELSARWQHLGARATESDG